jgi:hypothetical protein
MHYAEFGVAEVVVCVQCMLYGRPEFESRLGSARPSKGPLLSGIQGGQQERISARVIERSLIVNRY